MYRFYSLLLSLIFDDGVIYLDVISLYFEGLIMLTLTKTHIETEVFKETILITPEHGSYEKFVSEYKKNIFNKVQSVMDFISLKMDAKLSFQVNDFDNIFEIALMKFNFRKVTEGISTKCIITFDGFLTFECNRFAFKFDSAYSYFYSILNKQLDLVHFEYSSVSYDKHKHNVDRSINLKFDKYTNMTEYYYIVRSTFFGWELGRLKNRDMLCPYADELFLHSTITKRTPLMDELFPELYIDGVYDFASYDFKSRFTLFEMSLI